jgi:hypothetical protein
LLTSFAFAHAGSFFRAEDLNFIMSNARGRDEYDHTHWARQALIASAHKPALKSRPWHEI